MKKFIFFFLIAGISFSMQNAFTMEESEPDPELAKLEHQLNTTTLEVLLSKLTIQEDLTSINLNLPDELLVKILSFLSPDEITKALFTCKKWFQHCFFALGKKFKIDHKFYAHIITKALRAKKMYAQKSFAILAPHFVEHCALDNQAQEAIELQTKKISLYLDNILNKREISLGLKLFLFASLVACGLDREVNYKNQDLRIPAYFRTKRYEILEDEKKLDSSKKLSEKEAEELIFDDLTTRLQALAISCRVPTIHYDEVLPNEIRTLLTKIYNTSLDPHQNKINEQSKKELAKLIKELFDNHYITNINFASDDPNNNYFSIYCEKAQNLADLQPMIDAGWNLECLDEGGSTIHDVLGSSHLGADRELIREIHNKGICSITVPDNHGLSFIFKVIKNGNLDMVKEIFSYKNVDFKALRRDDKNLLQDAALYNPNVDVIRYLIEEQHFDQTIVDADGLNIKDYAALGNQSLSVILYLESLTLPDTSDLDILEQAIMLNGNAVVFEHLLIKKLVHETLETKINYVNKLIKLARQCEEKLLIFNCLVKWQKTFINQKKNKKKD